MCPLPALCLLRHRLHIATLYLGLLSQLLLLPCMCIHASSPPNNFTPTFVCVAICCCCCCVRLLMHQWMRMKRMRITSTCWTDLLLKGCTK